MPDIFLSYNREDQGVARWFAEAFVAEGFDVWWDVTLRSGEAYDEVTENALKTARAVVVLWSPRSVVSRWVRAEATLGDRNKTLIPVMIEPCERPIMFELTQTADLAHWRGEGLDPVWRGLVDDVRRFVERERRPATIGPAEPRKAEAAPEKSLPLKRALPRLSKAAALSAGLVSLAATTPSYSAVASSSLSRRYRASPALNAGRGSLGCFEDAAP